MARYERWFPLLLFLLALLVRAAAAGLTRFDGLYGQDPYAYYNFTLQLRQALAAGQLPPAFFWPMGYPMLVAAAMSFIGEQPLAGQLVSIFTGALIAPLVYILVCLVRPGAYLGGLVAGLLAAVSAQLLLSSLSVMSDAAAVFWATVSAWAMLRYGQAVRPGGETDWRLGLGWLALAAATLAAATLTRWVSGLLIIPWGLSAWLACREGRLPWRQIALAGGMATFIGLFFLALHFAPSLSQGEIAHTGDLEVVTWNPSNAVRQTVSNTDGTFHYQRPIGLYYALPVIHPAYIFPLFTPFLLLGLWALWVGDKTTTTSGYILPASQFILLAGWPLIVYLFLAGISWQNWRFPLTFFPPLVVLVGLGVDWVWARWERRWQPVIGVVLGAALIGSLAWGVRDISRFTAWKESQLATVKAVETQLPPGATLLLFELTATMRHYTDVAAIELFTQDEADVVALAAGNKPLYLLLNVDQVASQWVGKTPHQHYLWLQQHRELQLIGQYGPYTLFRVIGP